MVEVQGWKRQCSVGVGMGGAHDLRFPVYIVCVYLYCASVCVLILCICGTVILFIYYCFIVI